MGLKLEGTEVALTFSGLGSRTPCLRLGRIRQVVPAPGPMCLDSCALSGRPKIDWDMIRGVHRALPLCEESRGLPADF